MSYILKAIVKSIGIDKAIAYSSGARIIGGLAGVGTVFLISSFLSGVEQGFYYTFGSLLAMQVFFELGLTSIMTQFVAHEASHLNLTEDGKYQGDIFYLSRLASLVKFCVKWYTILAVIVVAFLIVVGVVYFNKFGVTQSSEIDWKLPWILICVTTGVKLFQSPFTSILNGLGYVKEMSEISFWQQIVLPVTTWIGLVVGAKLYVVGIGYFLSIGVWSLLTYRQGLSSVLLNLYRTDTSQRVSYFKEIFPLQWRIALSWISGYFIFNIFNVVLFAVDGAVVAGQMGMTLQVLNAIQAFSFSWLTTKVPLYSKLIALKNYVSLDNIFHKTLKQMSSVCGALLITFFIGVTILRVTQISINGNVIADRFLENGALILMIIPVFTHQFINSWATYLRCHKKEPFLVNSVTAGVLSVLSTIGLGSLYGLYGVTIGYFIIQLIMFPWGYSIFKNCKKKWHYEK